MEHEGSSMAGQSYLQSRSPRHFSASAQAVVPAVQPACWGWDTLLAANPAAVFQAALFMRLCLLEGMGKTESKRHFYSYAV